MAGETAPILTLDDVLKIPPQVTPEQLQTLGLLAPQPQPAAVSTSLLGPEAEKAKVAPMTPLKAEAAVKPLEKPQIETESSPITGGLVEPKQEPTIKPLDLKPSVVPEIKPLSSESFAQDYLNLRSQPLFGTIGQDWGRGPGGKVEPGILNRLKAIGGGLVHGLETAGQIAGGVVAPEILGQIPGTYLNKIAQENRDIKNFEAARTSESEEELRKAQAENQRSEAANRGLGVGKTADEQALAAKQRINAATAAGQQPDPKDTTLWQAYLDELGAKQEGKGTGPLGEAKVNQLNKLLERRYQVLNPGKPLPQENQVPKDATDKDYERIDKQMENTEKATATKAQQDAINEAKAEAQQLRKTEQESEVVRAVDKNNKVHLISRDEYEANKGNYQGSPIKMTPAALEKATDHATVINEMQGGMDTMAQAADKLNWADKGQQSIIKQALNQVDHSYADSVIGIPITKYIQDNLKQLGLEGATAQTRNYINALLSLRERALGLPKEITGGSRVSDVSANALWQTLPGGATPNREWALDQLRKMQDTIDRLKNTRVPIVPGLPVVSKDPLLYKHSATNPQTGHTIYSDDQKTWVDENGNPLK